MSDFRKGNRIRVKRATNLLANTGNMQSTKGRVSAGTEGTVSDPQPHRGHIRVKLDDGQAGYIAHNTLERLMNPGEEDVRLIRLRSLQKTIPGPHDVTDTEKLLHDEDITLRAEAARTLAHFYAIERLPELDMLVEAIIEERITFHPIAEKLADKPDKADTILNTISEKSADIAAQCRHIWDE